MMEGLNCGHMALKMVVLLLICILPVMALGNSFADQRATLRRVDDQSSLSFRERFVASMERSNRRVENIRDVIKRASQFKSLEAESEGGGIRTTVVAGEGEYLIEVGVGSPAVQFQGIADTGSDVLWTQCKPCKLCFKQPTPIFDPSKSSTYRAAKCNDSLCQELSRGAACTSNCGYILRYGDGSNSTGVLSYDTVTIGSGSGPSFKNTAFGCSHSSSGTGYQGSGLIGLGRGPLSLVSQLGSQIQNRFSYCLVDLRNPNATSTMFFGQSAQLKGGKRLNLKKNPLISTYWYVPVTGLTVGGTRVDIPPGSFELQADGTGGMIIDSGTTLTYVPGEVFEAISAAFEPLVDLPRAQSEVLDLCYQLPSGSTNVTLPAVVFNFEGGVNMPLPEDNTYVTVEENVVCLAFTQSRDIGILGNIQQQNFHFLYDNAQNTISFIPANCASL